MPEGEQKGSAERGSGKGRSARVNPILAIATLAVAGVVAWTLITRGTQSEEAGPEAEKRMEAERGREVLADEMERLADLGEVLTVGPGVEGLSLEGTKLVGEKEIPGMTELLDGRDVAAFAGALERRGISRVLADPGMVARNPIPEATVRNRLGLARPAGRLTASLMTERFFLWKLGEGRPDLSREAMEALFRIARAAAGAPGATRPESLPPILEKKGRWEMILTVRPVQSRHLSYHTTEGDTLAETAEALGKKVINYYFEHRKRIEKAAGPMPEALGSSIDLELEVLYDKGTFVGPRERVFLWRIIEPGIYGVRISIDGRTQTMPPWYTVANNYRTVSSMLNRITGRMARKSEDLWKEPGVPIERFRTVHWRERTPGGEIEELYRAMPRVPSTKDVTRDALVASLKAMGDWLADNQTYESGRYIYRYFPTKDEENDEYNMVRHALGPFSLALVHEFAPDPKYREKAEEGMRFMESHTRWGGAPRMTDGTIDEDATTWMGKPLPGEDVAIIEFDENEFDAAKSADWSSKLGGVAVAILGYTQHERVGWKLSPERERMIQGLANFVLYMQKEDGSFHHYYVAQKNRFYGTRNSIYPGEILYALARLYGETRDERFRTAFRRSMRTNLEWFEREMVQKEPDGTYSERRRKNLVQFQPWIAMAMEEMHRYDPDPAYVEASNLVSLWVMDAYQFDENRAFFPDYLGGYMKVLDELPAMHTFVYTEGTAASYRLARRAGADPEAIQRLRKGALLAARFILQMQVRAGENDYYYPNPKKARGGVRYCMNHNKQRIDYTYHALSSVYRILHAATPEDWEFVRSVPMPEKW